MSVPLGCAPLGTPVSSKSPFCSKVLVLGLFPVSPPLAIPSDDLASSPMESLPTPCKVPALTLQYLPLPGVSLESPTVLLVSGLPGPPGGAACRGHPSGLGCFSSPPWWGFQVSLSLLVPPLYFAPRLPHLNFHYQRLNIRPCCTQPLSPVLLK